MSAVPPARTGRDPAVVLWGAAGVCWTLTAVLVLAGTAGPCYDGTAAGAGGSSAPGPLALFAVWLVMTVAMMLPAAVPLARMVVVVTARGRHPAAARSAVLAGYLAVWTGFAVTALLVDHALAALVGETVRPGVVLGVVLVTAGLAQFSPVTRACLRACRSPWAFLWRHYARGVRGGWLLGVRHGLHCLGCCWALMLVMVATGVGSMIWMLALAAATTLEKTAPWGARLVGPLGVALVLAGIAVAVVPAAAAEAPGEAALLLTLVALAAVGSAKAAVSRRRNRMSAGTETRNEDRAPRARARSRGIGPNDGTDDRGIR